MSIRLVRRPKSPNWIIRGTLRGVRVEESTGTDNKKIAEEIRAKREAEILAQSVYGRRATATFAEAALSYLENGGNKRFLDNVISYFGTTALAKIDQDAIDVGARKVYPNARGATRDRQFYTPASAVIKHAAKRGWCSQIVMERPEKPPGRVRWISPKQADQLIEACNEQLRPLVIFLLYTGARIGEALWLNWSDVDLARGHVIFPIDPSDGRRTKNNEARGVPLHPRVCAALANLPHRDGEVFRRPDGLCPTRVCGRTPRLRAMGSGRRSRARASVRVSRTSRYIVAGTRGRPGTTPRTATFSRCKGLAVGKHSPW
jgi:integrase